MHIEGLMRDDQRRGAMIGVTAFIGMREHELYVARFARKRLDQARSGRNAILVKRIETNTLPPLRKALGSTHVGSS